MGIDDEVRSRRLGAPISAQRRFTNRAAEIALFEARRDELRRLRRDQPSWATDLATARRNVLVFHGHGGIGKSRLSRELRRRITEETRPEARTATVGLDFADPSARDPELFLLALRCGVAGLASRFGAFDTAFSVYWTRQHPGRPMSEFITHQSALGSPLARENLAEQLREVVATVVDNADPALGATRRLAGITWDAVRNSRAVRRLRRDCPFFEPCMEEDDLDALRLHLPLLLAWDLSMLKGQHEVDVVVLLDTFERVTAEAANRRKGGLEDTIARSAFFLPAVTFVVTTREALTWGESDRLPTLEMAGHDVWPGLAGGPEGPDQHVLGVLSPDDCESYLRTCLVDPGGEEPLIAAPLRGHIARMSGGVPLYLDVAVNHHLLLQTNGFQPQEDDFAAGIPEIVLRLMDDMNEDETDLTRVAGLLGVFDAPTLSAALPHVRDSTITSFLARSFVLPREAGTYSIHELLQLSVRKQDAFTGNPWSPEEWRSAGERMVRHWVAEFQDDQASLWLDRRRQALAFWQLCGLYATTDIDVEVLADIIMLVQLKGSWPVLESGRSHPAELLTPRGTVLVQMLNGILDRQIGDLTTVDDVLSASVASPHITRQMRRLATYYLAETRDLHSSAPLALYGDLSRDNDRIGTEAQLAHSHAVLRDGDVATALAVAEQFPNDADDPELCYRYHELVGTIRLCSGEFEDAAHHFELSRQVGETQQSPLLLALGLRHLALSWCWIEPDRAFEHLDRAEQLNQDLRLPPGIGQCLTARAVASIGQLPLDDVLGLLTEADETFTRAGYPDDALLPVAASVLAAATTGDHDLARERHQVMTERGLGRRPRTWLAVADIWAGAGVHGSTVRWTDGVDRAAERWQRPLTLRQPPLPSDQPPPAVLRSCPGTFRVRRAVEMVHPVEQVETAVDRDVRPCQITAPSGIGEEGDDLGHVIRLTQSACRHHRLAPGPVLFGLGHLVGPGVDSPG